MRLFPIGCSNNISGGPKELRSSPNARCRLHNVMYESWSREEVEATVADYFAMLELDLRGEDYNKSAHRRALLRLLKDRSDTAVERKHMNISAVLRDLDHPWIDGYKPYGNYQSLLFEIVKGRLNSDQGVKKVVEDLAVLPAALPDMLGLLNRWTTAPAYEQVDPVAGPNRERRGRKINYLKREAQNMSLGAAGEQFVLRFEAERLHSLGKTKLADRIEHVSNTQGDGLGYDILSFDDSGRERLIEVKTTAYGKRTPFFVTKNELECSRDERERYHLYRVFAFRKSPGLFRIQGPLDQSFNLEPSQYVARR